jgi:hypothetical protein
VIEQLITQKGAIEVARKAYVRRYVLMAEKQRMNWRIRDLIRRKIHKAVMGSMTKKQWLLHWVRQANFAWQARDITAWLNDKLQQGGVRYGDLLEYVR